MEQMLIRRARLDDIDKVKALADNHKAELGFVLRPALEKSILSNELLVASDEATSEVLGFTDFHHRRDEQTTLYHIVVAPRHRNQGIGTLLITALLSEANEHEKKRIVLKCPVDLDANNFYMKVGFRLLARQNGTGRDLNIWRIDLE